MSYLRIAVIIAFAAFIVAEADPLRDEDYEGAGPMRNYRNLFRVPTTKKPFSRRGYPRKGLGIVKEEPKDRKLKVKIIDAPEPLEFDISYELFRPFFEGMLRRKEKHELAKQKKLHESIEQELHRIMIEASRSMNDASGYSNDLNDELEKIQAVSNDTRKRIMPNGINELLS